MQGAVVVRLREAKIQHYFCSELRNREDKRVVATTLHEPLYTLNA